VGGEPTASPAMTQPSASGQRRTAGRSYLQLGGHQVGHRAHGDGECSSNRACFFIALANGEQLVRAKMPAQHGLTSTSLKSTLAVGSDRSVCRWAMPRVWCCIHLAGDRCNVALI
jgi:hypothetical protein